MDKSENWQSKRNKAVDLLAADIMPFNKVAEECGVRLRTLYGWTTQANFKRHVDIKRKEMSDRIMQRGIALKANRVARADDRWSRMHQVIAERAESPENQNVAGGKTGLLAHTVKSVGAGPNAQIVDEWEVDTGLLNEIRAHEEQVSKELGQWPTGRSEAGASVSMGDVQTVNVFTKVLLANPEQLIAAEQLINALPIEAEKAKKAEK